MPTPVKIADLPKKVADFPRKIGEIDDPQEKWEQYTSQPIDIKRVEKEAVEQPWIDPIDAVAGPLGFARKVGAKAVGKATAWSLAAEPVIGGAQGYIDKKLGDTPTAVKVPVNLLTGIIMGDILTTGAKQAGKFKGLRPKAGPFIDRASRKSRALREGVLESSEEVASLPTIEKSMSQEGAEKIGELYTKYVGSPLWDTMLMKNIPNILEKAPGGKSINRALIYDYRGDLPNTKEFIDLKNQMDKSIDVGQDYAVDIGRRLQGFAEKDQLRLGEYIRGEVDELPENLSEIGDEAKDALYRLGKEAVETGLLDEDTFFKNAGRYMPRLYSSKEYTQKLSQYGLSKPERLDLARFKKRKDIPKEIRDEMGEILTPGYPVAKGISQLTNDIQRNKFFNAIARNEEWAKPVKITKTRTEAGQLKKTTVQPEDVPDGFKPLPESDKLGELSGAYVHPEIYKELNSVAKTVEAPKKAWLKGLGAWKFGKVILSPKTHMRNVLSNSVLAHLGGMPMTSQPKYLSLAAKEMSSKGEYWNLAKREGLLDSSFVQKEMGQLFNNVEGSMKGIKANSVQDTLGAFGKGVQGIKYAGKKASDLYQAEEQWFKMGKFIHNIDRGMSPKNAAKDAEKWLFNYGKLTEFQDKYRKSPLGAPFATFTFKSLPRVAEAAIKYPWRFAAPLLMMHGLQDAAQEKFGDTEERESAKREILPDWMKGNVGGAPNFLRVPVADEHGREYYLNLTYILPWGDVGEGGSFMGIPGGIRPLSQPGVSELAQQIGNYDFFWESPIADEVDQLSTGTEIKKRGEHVLRHLAPTIAIDVEKGIAAKRGAPDYKGRVRPKRIVAADVFGGIKMYPVDYSERAVQLINKYNPRNGMLARKIKGQIETLSVKRQAVLESDNPNEKLIKIYDKEIDKKIKQIESLAEKTVGIGDSITKALKKEQ